MRKIKVIGVGPGGAQHLTPAALEAIRESGLLIGGGRHLESFAGEGQERLVLTTNFKEMVDSIRLKKDSGVAVLASGDPGMFGILKFLLKHFQTGDIEVIPGISSVQAAFAMLCMPWDDAVILSAHGRPAEKVADLARQAGKAAILTGTDGTPEKVYSLIGGEESGKRFYLCFDLSLPGEEIVRIEPGDAFPEKYKGRHNCVMVVVDG